jgi:hypothetical protein
MREKNESIFISEKVYVFILFLYKIKIEMQISQNNNLNKYKARWLKTQKVALVINLRLANLQAEASKLQIKQRDFRKMNTNIIVKCIDDNSSNQIGLSYVNDSDIYVDDTPNQTARTYATLVIEPAIDENKQRELVIKFNKFLDERRKKYNSLFLTNYRESKDIARKRISFDLVYLIVGYLLEND